MRHVSNLTLVTSMEFQNPTVPRIHLFEVSSAQRGGPFRPHAGLAKDAGERPRAHTTDLEAARPRGAPRRALPPPIACARPRSCALASAALAILTGETLSPRIGCDGIGCGRIGCGGNPDRRDALSSHRLRRHRLWTTGTALWSSAIDSWMLRERQSRCCSRLPACITT